MRQTRTIRVHNEYIPVYENENGVEFCPVTDVRTGRTFYVRPSEVKFARVDANQWPVSPEIESAFDKYYYGDKPYVACPETERLQRARAILNVVNDRLRMN